MGLTDSIRRRLSPAPSERGYWPWVTFDGHTYPLGLRTTMQGREELVDQGYEGLALTALYQNPVVYAAVQARMALFSEARFMWRKLRSGRPGELWSDPRLDVLRKPWPGGTTGDLLARMLQDADLSGTSVWLRQGDGLARLRPDWCVLVHTGASQWEPRSRFAGVVYTPGGSASGAPAEFYTSDEVAVFAPIPDPLAPLRGMSWLTPVIREIQADQQATVHKQAFFLNGATPNLVVTGVPGGSQSAFKEWVELFESKHRGAANAYKSLYLTAAMDAKVIGADLKNADIRAVQSAGEVRIATAAGVPAAVLGITEGLAGSSLNAGNFAAAMRRFADLTMRPLWRNACGSLEAVVPPPGPSELWYDDRDIAALKDDITAAAGVRQTDAQALRTLIDAGFEPDSAISAVTAGDFTRLRHTGLYSVQLQPAQPDGPPDPEPVPDPVPAQPAPAPDAPAREAAPPVVNVTIAEGAVRVESPVTVTLPERAEAPDPAPTLWGSRTLEYDAEGRVARVVEGPA